MCVIMAQFITCWLGGWHDSAVFKRFSSDLIETFTIKRRFSPHNILLAQSIVYDLVWTNSTVFKIFNGIITNRCFSVRKGITLSVLFSTILREIIKCFRLWTSSVGYQWWYKLLQWYSIRLHGSFHMSWWVRGVWNEHSGLPARGDLEWFTTCVHYFK